MALVSSAIVITAGLEQSYPALTLAVVSLASAATALWIIHIVVFGLRAATTPTVKKGQPIELSGDVLRVDEKTVTVNLSPPVTVDIGVVRLVTSYVPPARKKPLVDKTI
ncbi:hypothetical protein [Mesorhizobium sp. 113-3-3]|uniref:hypothetical protein n=1 Tax=Mesorhizobium sp. 113-3-3 TaxID=2744516 RepID=UPI0018EE2D8D|nr:hypothetical protein [Mesorhizobium sp. 113-3-3]BCG83371.1 hypothetical protein MesoLj113b_69130 [Mesorhizobium sp. 113-3-3]